MEHSPIQEYRDKPGVSDLPFSVGAPFAIALMAEDAGDGEKAEKYLLKAIEAEQKKEKAN